MTDTTIRPGTAADLDRLPAVERDAAQCFHAIGYGFAADGPVRDAEEHRRVLGAGAVLVAEAAGGTPLGFALVLPVDGRAHLLELAVARRAQGRGLGRALIGAAEAWGTGRGLAEITLTTFRDVPWNAPLYKRLGYEAFSPGADRPGMLAVIEEERRSGFHQRPRIVMRKPLGVLAGR